MQITDPRTGLEVVIQNGAEYWQEISAEKTCEHQPSEVRRWVNRNGGTAACRQCLICGRREGNPVGGIAHDRLPAADEQIAINWAAGVKERCEAIAVRYINQAAAGDEAWWADYNAYLQTEEWRARRHLVLKRCDQICEGCGIAEATEVHHMTYQHVGAEFLFELKGLCGHCHKRWHATEQ